MVHRDIGIKKNNQNKYDQKYFYLIKLFFATFCTRTGNWWLRHRTFTALFSAFLCQLFLLSMCKKLGVFSSLFFAFQAPLLFQSQVMTFTLKIITTQNEFKYIYDNIKVFQFYYLETDWSNETLNFRGLEVLFCLSFFDWQGSFDHILAYIIFLL